MIGSGPIYYAVFFPDGVFEISSEFDTDVRTAFSRQAEGGMYAKMALVAAITGKIPQLIKYIGHTDSRRKL